MQTEEFNAQRLIDAAHALHALTGEYILPRKVNVVQTGPSEVDRAMKVWDEAMGNLSPTEQQYAKVIELRPAGAHNPPRRFKYLGLEPKDQVILDMAHALEMLCGHLEMSKITFRKDVLAICQDVGKAKDAYGRALELMVGDGAA